MKEEIIMSSTKANLEKAMGRTIEESAKDSNKTRLSIEDRMAAANNLLSTKLNENATESKHEELKGKNRVIRKNISFPANDYKLLDIIKTRFLKMGIEINHSEIVRIGLIMISELPDEQLELTEKSIKRLKIQKIID